MKKGVIILGIAVFCFIAAVLIANFASTGSIGIETLGGVFNIPSSPQQTEECDCVYDRDIEAYICNEGCGDLYGAFCEEKSDCII